MNAIAHAAAAHIGRPAPVAAEVSLSRLYVLRATYLLLIVGLGLTNVPELVGHAAASRGVIPSVLGGLWLLAFVGLKYPLQMLPLLLFEFAWKLVWMLDYGLPQWTSGQMPATFPDDVFAIGVGVLLMPIVIPWGHVYRHYVQQAGARWR